MAKIRKASSGPWVAVALVCSGAGISHADPVGIVGPSTGEAQLYFFIPVALSFIVSLYLLTSMRGFVALMAAAGCTFVWVMIGRAELGSSVLGPFMLIFAAWANFAFVFLALLFTLKRPPPADVRGKVRVKTLVPPPTVEGPPFGRCPNCQSTIALKTPECPKCHAVFAEGVGWKVQPL